MFVASESVWHVRIDHSKYAAILQPSTVDDIEGPQVVVPVLSVRSPRISDIEHRFVRGECYAVGLFEIFGHHFDFAGYGIEPVHAVEVRRGWLAVADLMMEVAVIGIAEPD